MTEHLPECPMANDCKHDYYNEPPIQCADCGESCICDRLRACEQRVLAEREADGPWFRSVVHQCCEDKQTAYAAGLDAAREAVAALEPRLKLEKYKGGYDCCGCSTTYDLMKDALAAIDALREQS